VRDLYFALVEPHVVMSRSDWDNLSDDVCYADKSPETQEHLEDHLRDRQKKEGDMSDIEKEAHMSPEHCAKVCENEFPDSDDDNPSSESESGTKDDTALDSREIRKVGDRRLQRKCFQYRYHKGVCCTSQSFKLGRSKGPDPENEERWHSGWYLKGIKDWILAMGDCEVAWKTPS